jgi:hypothetical protein
MLTTANSAPELPAQWMDAVLCPKCEGPLTRHSFQVREKGRVMSIMHTYHCAQDGDVIPQAREMHHESQPVY